MKRSDLSPDDARVYDERHAFDAGQQDGLQHAADLADYVIRQFHTCDCCPGDSSIDGPHRPGCSSSLLLEVARAVDEAITVRAAVFLRQQHEHAAAFLVADLRNFSSRVRDAGAPA